MRKPKSRIYMRGGRYWADFRDYAPYGGQREPLVPGDERRATTDRDIAAVLTTQRLEQLEAARRGRTVLGITRTATLAAFAAEHLLAKKRAGKTTDTWLAHVQLHLERACAYFGRERDLASIGVADVRGWATHLGLPSIPWTPT